MMQKKVSGFCIILAIMFFLSGCMNMACTGAQALYNHHRLKKNISDQYISMQAYQALYFNSDEFKNTHIAITTYNGEVLLAGQVPNAWQKMKAGQMINQIHGIKQVYNFLRIEGPTSTLAKMSDAWITAKVKGKLMTSSAIDATQIKVVTENGMVYLMGIVHPDEAKAAIELASNTTGVQGVVKVFSYMTISKEI